MPALPAAELTTNGNPDRVRLLVREIVVAELRPPESRGPSVSDAVLAEAMRRGWLTAPLVAGGSPPPRLPVAPLGALLRELDADRGDR